MLVYLSHVQQYNWPKQSACATSLGENTVARSIFLGSRNVGKGTGLTFHFKRTVYCHFMIQAQMSELERSPTDLIQRNVKSGEDSTSMFNSVH